MEKQDKTFGSLSIFDKLYVPKLQGINEIEIKKISVNGDGNVKIRMDYDSITVKRSQTSFETLGRYYCVNRKKAIEIQEFKRIGQLQHLKDEAVKAQQRLSEYLDRYFSNDKT